MPYRKMPLAKQEAYHIYTKSIAEFKIFNSNNDYERMMGAIAFYQTKDPLCKFSSHKQSEPSLRPATVNSKQLVDIIAYCLMPTHIHLVLKQICEEGIVKFMHSLLTSYSMYFNKKHKRKGPLWEGRFKNILVKDDDQLLHLTRYIHLNPVTASLVNKPEDWKYSSYNEYLGKINADRKLCNFSDYIEIDPIRYREFVNDRIDYQKELALIKNLQLE